MSTGCHTGNGGALTEPGVRLWFWISIAVTIVLLIVALRGYWEWAVVGLIAALVFGRLPFTRWR
jgi:hypothetical protein